jgi:hypothetical protein
MLSIAKEIKMKEFFQMMVYSQKKAVLGKAGVVSMTGPRSCPQKRVTANSSQTYAIPNWLLRS